MTLDLYGLILHEKEKILNKAWCRETSSKPDTWTEEKPAWGQCAVTSLYLQFCLGGVLLRAFLDDFKESHYWNAFLNKEVDLTRKQFPPGTKIPNGEIRTRDYLLNSENAIKARTRERYGLLLTRIEDVMARDY